LALLGPQEKLGNREKTDKMERTGNEENVENAGCKANEDLQAFPTLNPNCTNLP
jgi:hypothetical protein